MDQVEGQGSKLRPRWVPWYKDWVLLPVIGIIFGLDQLTKYLVRSSLSLNESIPSQGAFRIVNTFNTGSAFGLFRDQTFFLILASIVGIGVLVVLYRHHSFPGVPLRVSLGLQVGGAIGNLVDRLRLGHVTDFVDIGSWPVFNLADASIVTGIVILVWLLLRSSKEAAYQRPDDLYYGYATVDLRGPQAIAALSICPLCDSNMIPVPNGWRCLECGAREQIESPDGAYLPEKTIPNSQCPLCDSPMITLPHGWRCLECGAREQIESAERVSSSTGLHVQP